ncbi:hypothetical protein L6R52_28655, partial [Myxococcota bacterium]|nr:hypothetical protein [Myxococcota bacterium]
MALSTRLALPFAALAGVALAGVALGCSSSTHGALDGGAADAAIDGAATDAATDVSAAGHVVLRGVHIPGRADAVDVELAEGIIIAVGGVSPHAPVVDRSGQVLVPAFVDAHVHLAYRPAGGALVARGVAAVLDLAAPLDFLPSLADGGRAHLPLRVISSGPMITAVDGYPTESWGRDGYGLEVATPDEGVRAVDTLHAAGAQLVKIPLGDVPSLDDATLAAVIDRAHAL